MNNKIEKIIDKYETKKEALIQIMQDVNSEYNYLPENELKYLSKKLSIPLSEIYGIATFYKAFSLTPRGKHLITVCLGTACHVRGGQRIVDKLERELKIKAGETSDDLMYTLETVNCLGACALAPIIVCDCEYHGQVNSLKVDKLLKKLKVEDAKTK